MIFFTFLLLCLQNLFSSDETQILERSFLRAIQDENKIDAQYFLDKGLNLKKLFNSYLYTSNDDTLVKIKIFWDLGLFSTPQECDQYVAYSLDVKQFCKAIYFFEKSTKNKDFITPSIQQSLDQELGRICSPDYPKDDDEYGQQLINIGANINGTKKVRIVNPSNYYETMEIEISFLSLLSVYNYKSALYSMPLQDLIQFKDKLFSLIVKNGADVNSLNQNGFNALDYAFRFCNPFAISILLDHNALITPSLWNDYNTVQKYFLPKDLKGWNSYDSYVSPISVVIYIIWSQMDLFKKICMSRNFKISQIRRCQRTGNEIYPYFSYRFDLKTLMEQNYPNHFIIFLHAGAESLSKFQENRLKNPWKKLYQDNLLILPEYKDGHKELIYSILCLKKNKFPRDVIHLIISKLPTYTIYLINQKVKGRNVHPKFYPQIKELLIAVAMNYHKGECDPIELDHSLDERLNYPELRPNATMKCKRDLLKSLK